MISYSKDMIQDREKHDKTMTNMRKIWRAKTRMT